MNKEEFEQNIKGEDYFVSYAYDHATLQNNCQSTLNQIRACFEGLATEKQKLEAFYQNECNRILQESQNKTELILKLLDILELEDYTILNNFYMQIRANNGYPHTEICTHIDEFGIEKTYENNFH